MLRKSVAEGLAAWLRLFTTFCLLEPRTIHPSANLGGQRGTRSGEGPVKSPVRPTSPRDGTIRLPDRPSNIRQWYDTPHNWNHQQSTKLSILLCMVVEHAFSTGTSSKTQIPTLGTEADHKAGKVGKVG
jgi:hypothetical protein